MTASSTTGTGQGSAETPIRQLQQLSKVLTLDGQKAFGLTDESHTSITRCQVASDNGSTGKRFFDGREIFQKTLSGDSFTVASSYGQVPHGITEDFDMVETNGYVDGKYDMYANYHDGTNFYWFWTGGGSFRWFVTMNYVLN